MLENGGTVANGFLPQLEMIEVTPWQCACGCASIHFEVKDYPNPKSGCHPIADFLFGAEDQLSGAFLFESGGVLRGLETYGLAGDAPKSLPTPAMLRPFGNQT